ncbi:ATP-binding protein [Pararobbsia alpina]|uniref:ATP-binding protein n=1 Tax=Pararobbsia alpina TaxID=621374 RepID=UPI0039A57E59
MALRLWCMAVLIGALPETASLQEVSSQQPSPEQRSSQLQFSQLPSSQQLSSQQLSPQGALLEQLSSRVHAYVPGPPASGRDVLSEWRAPIALETLPLSEGEHATLALHGHRLVIGIAPNLSPPLDITDLHNGVYGMSVDFAEAMGARLGVPVQWHAYDDRASMIEALRQHQIDAISTSTFGDGPGLVHSRPYVANQLATIERRAQGERQEDHPRRIAYVRDVVAQRAEADLERAYPDAVRVPYPGLIQALEAVSFGDADMLVGNLLVTSYLIDQLQLRNLAPSGYANFDEGGFDFAMRSDDAALANLIDRALESLPTSFATSVRGRWARAPGEPSFIRPLELTDDERAWIHEHPVVPYSSIGDLAPLVFEDARGQPAGIAIDVLDAISQETGLVFQGTLRAKIADTAADLVSGHALLTPFMVDADDERHTITTRIPYMSSLWVIVTRASSAPLRNVDALEGKRVVLLADSALWRQLEHVEPVVRLATSSSVFGAFDAVRDGDADATLMEIGSAHYAIGQYPKGTFSITGTVGGIPIPIHIGVRADQTELASILDKAIAHLPPGEVDAIRRRWLLVANPEPVWQRIRPRLVIATYIGGAVAMLFVIWAVSMRIQIRRRVAAERRLGEQLALQSELLDALRHARDEAEAANRAKSTFLATMSHEIRTPMNAILGLLELELQRALSDEPRTASLSVMQQAARDLLVLIDNVLDVSKMDAAKLELAPRPLEFYSWIDGIARLYENLARQRGLAFRVVCTTPRRVEAWVMADPVRLRQIIANLLSNAIKFTSSGLIGIEYGIVERRLAPDRGQGQDDEASMAGDFGASESEPDSHEPDDAAFGVTIRVFDTGVGIDDVDQAALFEPFSQVGDAQRGVYGGTGLGLSICKRLVVLMGGTLSIDSVRGEGTRVSIDLTLAQASPEESQGAVTLPEDRTVLKGLRVLVVDDHPANRLVMKQQAESLGCVVTLAVDGHDALGQWSEADSPFDVVLTDCSMPSMSGEALTVALRERERKGEHEGEYDGAAVEAHVRCIVIGATANAQPDARQRALDAGMDECLVKPLSIASLAHALSLACREAQGHVAPSVEDDAVLDSDPAVASAVDPSRLARFGTQCAALLISLRDTNREDWLAAHAALTRGDDDGLSALAHRIKGAVRLVGGERLVDACVQLETACASHDRMAVGRAFTVVSHAFDAFQADIEKAIRRMTH